MICKPLQPMCAAPLFARMEDTLILSCLQGIMGHIYTDDPEAPTAAMAILGDFAFAAGAPNDELIGKALTLANRDFLILVPGDDSWAKAIEDLWGSSAKWVTRYALHKKPEFDQAHLRRAAASAPEGYSLRLIDEKLYRQCQENLWSRDLVSQFPTQEDYARLGLGVAAVKNGQVVAGCSSYSRYLEGIEIEVDTHPDHRRRGLAYACSARLILECLKRGLYPSWDAQNLWSVGLAEKLGYRFREEYAAYEITPSKEAPK